MDIDRDALRAALPGLIAKADAKTNLFQSEGAAARAAGLPITADPNFPGSWVSNRWLEGWTGAKAPERTWTEGGFNMTPAEHVAAFCDWICGLGIDPDRAARAIELCRQGYSPEALGSTH